MTNKKIFLKKSYSDYRSLKIFLDSLSYHKVGAAFFCESDLEIKSAKKLGNAGYWLR